MCQKFHGNPSHKVKVEQQIPTSLYRKWCNMCVKALVCVLSHVLTGCLDGFLWGLFHVCLFVKCVQCIYVTWLWHMQRIMGRLMNYRFRLCVTLMISSRSVFCGCVWSLFSAGWQKQMCVLWCHSYKNSVMLFYHPLCLLTFLLDVISTSKMTV